MTVAKLFKKQENNSVSTYLMTKHTFINNEVEKKKQKKNVVNYIRFKKEKLFKNIFAG